MARDLFVTLDLNLLKTFRVLYEEENMRRTADRLFVTQPAISQALKKLRHHFGDELFVKTHGGLKPTAFSNALMERLGPVMDDLSGALNKGLAFDPSELGHAIRIALAPHLISFLSTKLFTAIRREAPSAEVRLDSWNGQTLDNLVKGEIDLAVSVDLELPSRQLLKQALADDIYRAYVREDHPVLGNRRQLTLEDLDGSEIAALIVPEFNDRETHIERLLKANGYEARVGLRSALSSALTEAVRGSDMIYGASSFIQEQELKGLRILDVKINDEYLNYPVTAYYHRRNRRNPLTAWLIETVGELLPLSP